MANHFSIQNFNVDKKSHLSPFSDIQNAKLRAQKHGAETLTAVSQTLCLPLRDLVKGYKTELRRLHPFEKVVADLTVRARQKKDGLTLMQILVSEAVQH